MKAESKGIRLQRGPLGRLVPHLGNLFHLLIFSTFGSAPLQAYTLRKIFFR